MKNVVPGDLFSKIQAVTTQVRLALRRRGIVIPIKNPNGTVSLGSYTVVKNLQGFYQVINERDEIIVDNINLPETAAMVDNDLALGRILDYNIISQDRDYGYALFEETLHQRAIRSNKNLESMEIRLTKFMICKIKRESCKREIIRRFKKFRSLV